MLCIVDDVYFLTYTKLLCIVNFAMICKSRIFIHSIIVCVWEITVIVVIHCQFTIYVPWRISTIDIHSCYINISL